MNIAFITLELFQWIAIIGLGLMCLALMRQVGILHERIAPAGALSMNGKIKVGDFLPPVSLTSLSGKSLSIGGASSHQRSNLVFFLSPDCPVCKTLLPIVKSLAKAEKSWLDVTLASDGKKEGHEAFIQKHKLEGFEYVLSEKLGRTLGISKLPYGVLLNKEGNVSSMGLVNSREHLESLLEAQERGVASIQEYMNQRNNLKKQAGDHV